MIIDSPKPNQVRFRMLVAIVLTAATTWSCSSFKPYILYSQKHGAIDGVYSGIVTPSAGAAYRMVISIAESDAAPVAYKSSNKWVFVRLDKFTSIKDEGPRSTELKLYTYGEDLRIYRIGEEEFRIHIQRTTNPQPWPQTFQVECKKIGGLERVGGTKSEVLAEVIKRPDVYLRAYSKARRKVLHGGRNAFTRLANISLELLEKDPRKAIKQRTVKIRLNERLFPSYEKNPPPFLRNEYKRTLAALTKALNEGQGAPLALFYPEAHSIEVVRNGIPWYRIQLDKYGGTAQRVYMRAEATAEAASYFVQAAEAEKRRMESRRLVEDAKKKKRDEGILKEMTDLLTASRARRQSERHLFIEPAVWAQIWAPFEIGLLDGNNLADSLGLDQAGTESFIPEAKRLFPLIYNIFNGDCSNVGRYYAKVVFMTEVARGSANFGAVKQINFKKTTTKTEVFAYAPTITTSNTETYAEVRINTRYYDTYNSFLTRSDSPPSPYLFEYSRRYNIFYHLAYELRRHLATGRQARSSITAPAFHRQLLENAFRCLTSQRTLQESDPDVQRKGKAAVASIREGGGMERIDATKLEEPCVSRSEKGCEDGEDTRFVSVKAFSVDRMKVTVGDYRRCADAGACSKGGYYNTLYCNWVNPGRSDRPMNCATREQAERFCVWANKRLPSGVELEVTVNTLRRRYGDEWMKAAESDGAPESTKRLRGFKYGEFGFRCVK